MVADLMRMLGIVGIIAAITGMTIEFVAAAGISNYQVRKRLPCRSPISLQGRGCNLFLLGVALAAISATLD